MIWLCSSSISIWRNKELQNNDLLKCFLFEEQTMGGESPVETHQREALIETLRHLQSVDRNIRSQAEANAKALEVTDGK